MIEIGELVKTNFLYSKDIREIHMPSDSYSGLFRFNSLIDDKYTAIEMIEILGLDKTKPICDGYGHHISCKDFVQECKSKRNITYALLQLESTIKQLKEKSKKIDKIFLILECIGRSDKREYYRGRDLCLYKKDVKTPIYIEGLPIILLYNNELTEDRIKWQF